MHRETSPRYGNVKLCFVRWLNARTGTLAMTLVDSLCLAGVTRDSYSLVEMQSGPFAKNLASIEYDLAIINVDHGPELVIEGLLLAVFNVFRKSDPVAD